MPGGRRTRVPVQQHDRRAVAAMAHKNRRFAEVDPVFLKSFEHTRSLHQPRHPVISEPAGTKQRFLP